ncbi:allatostatin-A [Drosophila nasuta]|uniref:Allatostatin-A n=1 Tax=Drosophila albomicans TaxID=7291 RepID=A0A6P8XJJ3_DROAB|nr:allatostatin-A [Drosophila albomicans]XP_034116727.1 allatostatin-A [Drosophila albomicans]XP_060650028.1 allatostatin-A [Drosophila nasuta]XP_060650029.1 allatostatin-A [Drosophila nasuta]
MNMLNTQMLLLALYCLGYVCCSPAIGAQEPSSQIGNDGDGENDMLMSAVEDGPENGGDIDKRVERYAFGLGRRAYMYTNGGAGMKRLPVYNFGLGKRSRPYSFGLGKRNDYDYDQDNEIDYRAQPLSFMGAAGRSGRQYKRTTRPQPFNFGLGRR